MNARKNHEKAKEFQGKMLERNSRDGYSNFYCSDSKLKALNAQRIIQRQRYPSNCSFVSLHFPWLSFIPLLHNLATYAASPSTDADVVVNDDDDDRQVFGTFSSLRQFDPQIPKCRAHLFDTLRRP